MHTQQSAKELLYSLPVKVRLAGFESTTLRLAKDGWDLSMRQNHNHYGEYEMQLALRHGDAKFALYALSAPVQIPRGKEMAVFSNFLEYSKFFTEIGFDMTFISSNVECLVYPMRDFSISAFSPVDAIPSERMTTERVNMKNLKFFKQVNPSLKDVIVHPSQVPELLDMVLGAQVKMQKEIREREESRRNFNAYRSGEMFDAKPAYTVQAQIITLAV